MVGMVLHCASLVWVFPAGRTDGRYGYEPYAPIINLCYPIPKMATAIAALDPDENLRVAKISPEDIYLNCLDMSVADSMPLLEVFIDCRRIVSSFGLYGAARFAAEDLDGMIDRIDKHGFYVTVVKMPKTYSLRDGIAAIPRVITRGLIVSRDLAELRPLPTRVDDYGLAEEILPCYDDAAMQERRELRETQRLERQMLQSQACQIEETHDPRPK